IRGNVYEALERHEEALENYGKALDIAEAKDDILLHMAYVHQSMGDYDSAVIYLKKSLEHNMENQDALYELAFCYDVLDKQEESIAFYQKYIDNEPYSYA